MQSKAVNELVFSYLIPKRTLCSRVTLANLGGGAQEWWNPADAILKRKLNTHLIHLV